MDRRQLESAGENYPYLYFQGLWAVPAGLVWVLVGLANLERRSVVIWVLACGGVITVAISIGIQAYYERNFGQPVLSTRRRVRYTLAAVGGFIVFLAADQLGLAILGRPPQQRVSLYAASWALGILGFYAASAGLKAHHIMVWGGLLVIALLPIWGLGSDRDAIASFPIAAATIISGILDNRLLLSTFRSYQALNLGESDAGSN